MLVAEHPLECLGPWKGLLWVRASNEVALRSGLMKETGFWREWILGWTENRK